LISDFSSVKIILQQIFSIFAVLGVLSLCGCATPVGVNQVSEKTVYRQIDESVLNSDDYSSYTAVVLHRYDLAKDEFDKEPKAFIKTLHHIACNDDRRNVLLALSELCFLTARQAVSANKKQPFDNREFFYSPLEPEPIWPIHDPVNPDEYFLGAAVYAYLFLLGPGSEPPPGSFDRQFRLACDLYNRSLSKVTKFINGRMVLKDTVISLPVGLIHLSMKTVDMPWDINELETVLSADLFSVHGLSVRNRISGLGAPVIAVRKKIPGMPMSSTTPATVFLEIKGEIGDMKAGTCTGEIGVYSSLTETEITVDDKKIPLEADLTAPVAYSLNNPMLWDVGWSLFRMGRSLFDPGIYTIQPYDPGLIPIIFVHGTMSSPVWWAEMLNTLRSDPQVRKHFQIWLYLYDSGKPVAYSAYNFREAILEKVKQFDPDGNDSVMEDIVIVGHSQGGILVRAVSVETGDAVIKVVLGKSLGELEKTLSPEDLALVEKYGVYHPMPEVSRVIFISTPHRGSILAENFARRMANYLIALPKELLQTSAAVFNIFERFSEVGKLKWHMARTSIDSMSPDNPGMLAIADQPIPSGIKAHSIIAIKGGEIPPKGDDGVVAYTSAHLDGVESELVVPYGHSCQMESQVIEEVRRILIEHIQDININKKEHSK
jgi:pimeloyl-ACP methyl ester carboxylesterase